METKLLYVETNNSNQKNQLQSEYLAKNDRFVVPTTETETVESIIRSQCFQYFQNSLPPLAEKIKQFAFKTLNMTLSLTLLREILVLASQQHNNISNFRQYFLDMNRIISEENESNDSWPLQECGSEQENKDHLFQRAERGQMHATRLLEQIDLSQELDRQCQRLYQTKVLTQNTRETTLKALNPEEDNKAEKVVSSNNILSVFYSAQGIDESQWWKKQNHFSDESKEISKFERRGGKAIHQKSITRLVIDEMKRDLNRQIELGKDIHKHQEHMFKFNKVVKNKLTHAKLRKRRR